MALKDATTTKATKTRLHGYAADSVTSAQNRSGLKFSVFSIPSASQRHRSPIASSACAAALHSAHASHQPSATHAPSASVASSRMSTCASCQRRRKPDSVRLAARHRRVHNRRGGNSAPFPAAVDGARPSTSESAHRPPRFCTRRSRVLGTTAERPVRAYAPRRLRAFSAAAY
jgi:hypothetical protein